jgi:SAM-dependent methyltransferase
LSNVLALFGLERDAIDAFKHLAHDAAGVKEDDTLAYERILKRSLIGQTVFQRKDEALNQRAKIIYEEIKPFLDGDSLLDIGCGNGLISNLAKDHFKQIQLLDVVKYLPRGLGLPFVPYTEGQLLPIRHVFDTVLLLTVLHHANNPDELLRSAWGATRKKLIIIESVVGIRLAEPPVKYDLVNSPLESQIAYATFVDWFYNRVLHDDVPVPYNFTTPETWERLFLRYKMRCVQTVHLGQDIDIGPEYHILFVLEKSIAEGSISA